MIETAVNLWREDRALYDLPSTQQNFRWKYRKHLALLSESDDRGNERPSSALYKTPSLSRTGTCSRRITILVQTRLSRSKTATNGQRGKFAVTHRQKHYTGPLNTYIYDRKGVNAELVCYSLRIRNADSCLARSERLASFPCHISPN